jgi:DNA-directed RNA polymerase subunit F
MIKQIPENFLYNKSKSTNNHSPQKVKIRGIFYLSIREAAKTLNESRTNIRRLCLNSKNKDYEFIELFNFNAKNKNYEFIEPLIKSEIFPVSQPCKIDNIIYTSMRHVSRELKIPNKQIKKRLFSSNYPTYIFFD